MKNSETFTKYKFNKKDFDIDILQSLSDREREVVEVYSSIKTQAKKRITAEILGVTEHTIRAHLHSIFIKLNVTNHIDMIIVANAIGEIDLLGEVDYV